MPITTIGKIFKPQLIWWEAENVAKEKVSALLLEHNISSSELDVKADKDEKHGYIVTTTLNNSVPKNVITEIEEKIGKFHFKHQIVY